MNFHFGSFTEEATVPNALTLLSGAKKHEKNVSSKSKDVLTKLGDPSEKSGGGPALEAFCGAFQCKDVLTKLGEPSENGGGGPAIEAFCGAFQCRAAILV